MKHWLGSFLMLWRISEAGSWMKRERGRRCFLSVRIINQLAYKRVCTGLEKQELREFIWQMSDQELDKMMEILYYSPENGVTVIELMERFLDRVYAEMARKRYDLAAERK